MTQQGPYWLNWGKHWRNEHTLQREHMPRLPRVTRAQTHLATTHTEFYTFPLDASPCPRNSPCASLAFARSSGGQGNLKMQSNSHLSSAPSQTRVRRATKLSTAPCYVMGHLRGQARRAPGARQANSRGVTDSGHAGASRRF